MSTATPIDDKPITQHERRYCNSLNFNPLSACSLIRDVLRAFFQEFGDAFGSGLVWDADPKKRKVDITTVNDIHQDAATGYKPRILVGRGQIQSEVLAISGDLENSIRLDPTGRTGDKRDYKRIDVSGNLTIVIEANQEGVCEVLAETIRRYLTWSRGDLEARFGFQRFADRVFISECSLDSEDREKFKIQVNVPYRIEDRWFVTKFHMKLKHVFTQVTSS